MPNSVLKVERRSVGTVYLVGPYAQTAIFLTLMASLMDFILVASTCLAPVQRVILTQASALMVNVTVIEVYTLIKQAICASNALQTAPRAIAMRNVISVRQITL